MKLAEALALRADVRRRVEQLRSRIVANARYQDGEEPSENAAALMIEADQALDELETLIGRINSTNSTVQLDEDLTMTAALAKRDVLRLRHSVLVNAADAAAGQTGFRQLRSELRVLSALPVAEVRSRIDDVARELRELDTRIQEANWRFDLAD